MNFSWWSFALQAANFLILVWLLRRFLFKPVSAIVARRREEIARGMAQVSAEKQKALNLQRDLQAQRAGIEAERQKAIEEQGAQLAAERRKMIDEARAEAEKIRNHAATQLIEERAAATQELFSRTIELAVSFAERLLRGLAFPSIEHAFLPASWTISTISRRRSGPLSFRIWARPLSWLPRLTRSTRGKRRNGASSSKNGLAPLGA